MLALPGSYIFHKLHNHCKFKVWADKSVWDCTDWLWIFELQEKAIPVWWNSEPFPRTAEMTPLSQSFQNPDSPPDRPHGLTDTEPPPFFLGAMSTLLTLDSQPPGNLLQNSVTRNPQIYTICVQNIWIS